MRNVVFLFLMVFASTSWAQFDDVYSSSPWNYDEKITTLTSIDESYNASVDDATIYSDIDFYNDEYWMYDDYDFRYSRNINRFYQPIYGTTFYDFRYTNGFYYTYNPWDWGVNIYVNTSPWRPRRWGWNAGWNNVWWGGGFGPTYSVTTFYGWVSPWPMYNSWHTSWGYGGMGWNNTWFGGYSNWYGHQYWAYNNPFCSGFGFDYNDWYANAGNIHYGPRLGGTSYGNRTKNKSFVMQEDGFDNPRMQAQGLSLSSSSASTEKRSSQEVDGARIETLSSRPSSTRLNNQPIHAPNATGSLQNGTSESHATSRGENNVLSNDRNQQGVSRGNFSSQENTPSDRKTENVNSSANSSSNRLQENNTLQQSNSNQPSRGSNTQNNSTIQQNQRQQSSQGNGSFSNTRRSNVGKSSSGNNRSNQSNLNRSNGGSRGTMNNGGGNNRSNGGGNSNPRSRGGGR